jgi:tuftelin-interacting protein 11
MALCKADFASGIDRIVKVQQVVAKITTIVAEQASQSDPSLHALTESFEALLSDHKDEYSALSLDEVLVGAIAQVVSLDNTPESSNRSQLRRTFSEWQPFDISTDILLSSLKQWRKAYNLPRGDDQATLSLPGSSSDGGMNGHAEREATAWESLLWNLWLPKVRAAIK